MASTELVKYRSWAYNTKERLCSFWHQADEVRRLGASTVVEVGIGSGTVAGWLRDRGIEVTTVDVDPELGPDVCGSVTDLPLDDDAFDVALCCEVLEHLPFDHVVPALRELGRVARLGVVFSAPDDRPWLGVSYPLYFGMHIDAVRRRYPIMYGRPLRRTLLRDALARRLRWREAAFLALVPERWSRGDEVASLDPPPIPHMPWRHDFDGDHHWVLGTAGYPVQRLTDAFAAAGLTVDRDFRVPENPWHHFWVLRPAGAS
jgi:SAM-dependent methyltransferase